MISEHRLSKLVGQIRGVDYQLCSKRELAGELVSTADEYNSRALEPAASVSEAAESTDTAAMISRLGEGEQQRLAEEIGSLEQEKARLLSRLYEEGMQTDRWIGVGDRYVQLSGADGGSNEDSGSDLRLHDIPCGYERYMLSDEAPEVTARRVSYATGYSRRAKELGGILLTVMLAGLVYSFDLLPLWLTWASFAAVVAASAFALPRGWRLSCQLIGPGKVPDSPWLEVMPDSGERFDANSESSPEVLTGEEVSASESSSEFPEGAAAATDHRYLRADDYKRGRAYAEIKAAQHTTAKKARTKR